MYQPKRFAQTDVATIHDLIRARPLATLVTLVGCKSDDKRDADRPRMS